MRNRIGSSSRQFAASVLAPLLLSALCGALLAYSQSPPPDPLSQRILVVYNTNFPDSLDVANYSVTRRAIPVANLCGISPPREDFVSAAEYESTVRVPIQV